MKVEYQSRDALSLRAEDREDQVTLSVFADIADKAAVRRERLRVAAMRAAAAALARDPYGDEVRAIAGDEPATVGEKIATAIERLPLDAP